MIDPRKEDRSFEGFPSAPCTMKFTLNIDKNAVEEEICATVHAPSTLTHQIEDLVRGWAGEDRVAVYTEDQMLRIPFEEIECVTVIDRKLYALTASGERFRLRQKLCEIEPMLPSYFVRINKSSIANQRRIRRFKTAFSGAVDAVFQSGYTDYVSRRCLADLKRRLKP